MTKPRVLLMERMTILDAAYIWKIRDLLKDWMCERTKEIRDSSVKR